MTRLLKVTLLSAAMAVAMGSSAFANTYLNEMGSGDLHPIVYRSSSWTYASARHHEKSARHSERYVTSTRHTGRQAYAMVGQRVNPNHPTLTGGGSIGYNANLLIY